MLMISAAASAKNANVITKMLYYYYDYNFTSSINVMSLIKRRPGNNCQRSVTVRYCTCTVRGRIRHAAWSVVTSLLLMYLARLPVLMSLQLTLIRGSNRSNYVNRRGFQYDFQYEPAAKNVRAETSTSDSHKEA